MKPKRKQSPAAKKRLDYTKQRRGFSEYAHSLRHGKWRRKKRRPAQQAERQAERIAVATPAVSELRDPGFDPGSITRPKIAKWELRPSVSGCATRSALALSVSVAKRDARHAHVERTAVRAGASSCGHSHPFDEPPAERVPRQPEIATLTIRARQDGSLLVLEISDDGRGIDSAIAAGAFRSPTRITTAVMLSATLLAASTR